MNLLSKNTFTNKNLKYFIITSIALLVTYLILLRYSSPIFKIDSSTLNKFVIISVLNIILLNFSIILYKKYLNPISLFCLFIFYYSYSLIPLTSSFEDFSKNTHIVILITIFAFISGAFFSFFIIKKEKFTLFNNQLNNNLAKFQRKVNNKTLLYTLFLLSIFVFIIEISLIGYIPVFKMFTRFVYEEANDHMITFAHYFVILSAILPAWSLILYKDKKISKKYYYIIHIVSFFINFNFFSRQFILLYMIATYFAYLYYSKASIKLGIIVISSMLLMFVAVGFLRIMQDNTRKPKIQNTESTQVEYLNKLSKTQYKLTVIENYLTVYSSGRFYELNKMINQKDSSHYLGYGMYTFKPIVSVLFLNRLNIVDYETKFNIPKAVPTFVIDSYLDFGYIGSFLINFIYGIFASLFFFSYWQNKKSAIINFSIIVFCIVMMPFMNYFNTFFIWFVLIINSLMIKNE